MPLACDGESSCAVTIIEERLNAAVAARDRSITEAVARPGRDALAEAAFERALELYRRELTGYCYRLLGSWDEAEDAVQDAFLRAWRSVDAFEGRAQLRSWLYKIATNVCLTMLDGRRRRALPMDLEGPSSSDAILGGRLPDGAWIQPIADRLAIGPSQAYARTKALLQATLGDAFEAQLRRETESFAACAATADFVEGVRAFLEKRDPVFVGR